MVENMDAMMTVEYCIKRNKMNLAKLLLQLLLVDDDDDNSRKAVLEKKISMAMKYDCVETDGSMIEYHFLLNDVFYAQADQVFLLLLPRVPIKMKMNLCC